MFSKLFNKHNTHEDTLNPRVILHCGLPSTSSRIAYDPIQSLLAICTLDGRIKVIGGDNIEGLLIAPKQLPFKHLEFLENQGFLICVSNENDVQVWDLEHRYVVSTLQWHCNITAFVVFQGTSYMYLGDEYGSVSVLMYDVEDKQLLQNAYRISAQSVSEATGVSMLEHRSVVGILSQPASHGKRLLFAYDNGIIVLWDMAEDRLLVVKGDEDLHLKGKPISISGNDTEHEEKAETSEDEGSDKEISAVCWAALDGSRLAVGYVDGDIMLWKLSNAASPKDGKAEKPDDVVKLQLSSSSKRFPVIILHWSAGRSKSKHGDQLFVYGGDQMGSAEVLTILNLEWSSNKESLKNVTRVDLTLHGSFADMILLRNLDPFTSVHQTSMMILTSPGQLHFYDDSCLSALICKKDCSVSPIQYSCILPTSEPPLTVGIHRSFHADAKTSAAFSEIAKAVTLRAPYGGTDEELKSKWPLSGGVPGYLPLSGDYSTERVYIAGYGDGSVRIWDTTCPVLSPLLILEPEVEGTTISGITASVSALDFTFSTLTVAVGSESGLVRLYMLSDNCEESRVHIVTKAGSEVHESGQVNGPYCSAVFSLCAAPVCTLRFSNLGEKLAVGYESGQIAMLDVSTTSVSFLKDILLGRNSPIVSLATGAFLGPSSLEDADQPAERMVESAEDLAFVLQRDSHVAILSTLTGEVISSHSLCPEKELDAVGMYILEGTKLMMKATEGKDLQSSSHDDMLSEDSLLLLCCTGVITVYSLKSLIQGNSGSMHKVKLTEICCWTATVQKDETECMLVVLYQTGLIEIRSLPFLEILGRSSLMSILRWNFKPNMDKSLSTTHRGQIALVNGAEFAIVSILASENDFRVPDSLPCLHDKVLAAAVDANTSNLSSNQKKDKQIVPRIFGGLIKSFKANKEAGNVDPTDSSKAGNSSFVRLFPRSSKDPIAAATDAEEPIELSIDDIEIDEPIIVSPLPKSEHEKKDKKTEREALFEGVTSEVKPRPRTIDEIKAKYRKEGDTSAAAARARDKLAERGEKLERISQRSEELRDGAESFASMAQELAKRMENRKWWQL